MAICAAFECDRPTVGKSKYCSGHRATAREAWRQKVQKSTEEREARYAHFADVFQRADAAGLAAAKACVPTPMVVTQRENPLDDDSAVKKAWYVPEGVCGFAWITIYPGNCSAAYYAKKHWGASKAYRGGMQIWCRLGTQSYEIKTAYADAFAKVLQDAGIKAYSGGRLD